MLGVIVGYVGGIFRQKTEPFFGTIQDKNEYLLVIALPLLIYKICLCLEVHSFMRCIYQVLIIAVPCEKFSTIIFTY